MKKWKLSGKQRGRLEHAHLLRVAIPVPVLYEGISVILDREGDEQYVENVLDVEPKYIRSVHRRNVFVVPRPGQGGNEGIMGMIVRPKTLDVTRLCYPILTVKVLVIDLAQPHRDFTEEMPIQWAQWIES